MNHKKNYFRFLFLIKVNRINFILKFLIYLVSSKHKRGHGIHSPFVFNLIQHVFGNKQVNTDLIEIKKVRKKLSKSKKIINLKGFGAGSHYGKSKQKLLGKIVNISAISKKYGHLLYRLVQYYKPNTIIELGTSVGISTMYMAIGSKKSKVFSIEGEPELVEIARNNIKDMNLDNAELFQSNFDDILPEILNKSESPLLIYIDGNHNKDATLGYFNKIIGNMEHKKILVIDDINWSREMNKAWKAIKTDKRVKVTIDIFKMGLVFFNEGLSKQNYTIKF